MTVQPPALRFYQAAQNAARETWGEDATPSLLLRIGLPGLMSRLGYGPPAVTEEGFLPLQQLYHTLLLEAAQEVTGKLSERSVQHFFVKGIALLNRFYEPGDRAMSDMDIYIARSELDEVLSVLNSIGYQKLPEPEQAGPPELRTAMALARSNSSEMERHVIDLHWSLDPVERLLPRRNRDVPERVWDQLDTSGQIPVPSFEHHAAMLTHHLVHTDLLHVRNLLDLAYLFDAMPIEAGLEYRATCKTLRIGQFATVLARIVAKEFGIERRNAIGKHPERLGHFESKHLTLENWLKLVARSHPHDDETITVRRIRRRLVLVDKGGAKTLFQDLFFPPEEFLRWRWGKHSAMGARFKHCQQLFRKMLPW